MKIKISDYIVEFLNKNGINNLFTITGGFSMHLNDSFGNNKNYEICYQHHEQSCGYSAIGYTKTNGKISIVCTTSGCAATNVISPCLVAYQDSLPILFISGQVKRNDCISKLKNDNIHLRSYAGADSNIISMVNEITKYSFELLDINDLDEMLNNTIKNLINGRPGPVWLSIPVDIQSMIIEYKEIPIIDRSNNIYDIKCDLVYNMDKIYDLLIKSERPLIIAGNGIKLGNCNDKFIKFINIYEIPVVVSWHGTDLLETDNKLFSGKIGIVGDRSGNFSLQNSDLIISLGCRMSQSVIGYRSDWFAREAKIIYIDIDKNEIEKKNINYEIKINIDLNLFFDYYINSFYNNLYYKKNFSQWIKKCNHWKSKWLFETPQNVSNEKLINPYNFLKLFFNIAPDNKVIVASSGSIIYIIWHMINIKKGDKFIISSQGDMGFEIPASIGAQISDKNKLIISILGDGSFQMNIQELQTIIHYKLPIKILLFNNNSYGAIKITQKNYFENKYGVDSESGISFPDAEKIANAYGIKYMYIKTNDNTVNIINDFLNYSDGSIILEIFCSIQERIPKLDAIKNEDGTFTNRPFEDMKPFINREEFEKEMIIKCI